VRRIARYAACLAGMVLALSAAAQAPDRSPRPELRPGAAARMPITPAPRSAQPAAGATSAAPASSGRPVPRPLQRLGPQPVPVSAGLAAIVDAAIARSADAAPTQDRNQDQAQQQAADRSGAQMTPTPPSGSGTVLATRQSLRPMLRPEGLAERSTASAARNISSSVAQLGQRGALCGQAGLEGERLEPIAGRVRGCGIAEPVRLRVVDGIALSTPATVNCETARALQTWVRHSVVPTVGRHGGGVRSLRVVASFACRTQNNRPGARMSEHGRGNAIDIAGVGLADGGELTVLGDWRTRREGRILRALHAGACGPFGTVLGPQSDRFHRDHFHFDVARHRSGPFCR
jgi:hypothetical protein